MENKTVNGTEMNANNAKDLRDCKNGQNAKDSTQNKTANKSGAPKTSAKKQQNGAKG